MTVHGNRPAPLDDVALPFMLERSGVRGRLVRMGEVVETLLSRHDYPDVLAGLMGEAIALTACLASLLKFDGVFTLQSNGDGPVSFIVADVTSEGQMRAYADNRAESRLKEIEAAHEHNHVPLSELLGRGRLAFTVDRGPESQRYQGIVEIAGERLSECLQHYFMQSEQISSSVQAAADRSHGNWRAAALMLQRMPEDVPELKDRLGAMESLSELDEGWRRAVILQSTCRREELLDPRITNEELLYRLFHEEGVRVFRPRTLAVGCRCSRERIEAVLAAMTRERVEQLMEGDEVVVTCQFCNRSYRFDRPELDRIFEG